MKKIFLGLPLMALILLAACDYNERNFDGLEDVTKPANVAIYEISFDGKYPTDGYFSSKEEIVEKVIPWLDSRYYTCDSGSVAKVSLVFADSVEVPAITGGYRLVAEDYDSMGIGANMPGKYNNFSESINPERFLPVFLKLKYPYATAYEAMAVTYTYFAKNVTKDSTTAYVYDGNSWSVLASLSRVDTTTKIAEFSYAHEWKLNKVIGGIEKYLLVAEDYQALFGWSKANKPKYLGAGNPASDEYYFGVSAKFNNVNNKVITWKGDYNIDGEYTGKTDDEIREIMHSRIAGGFAELVLPMHIAQPQEGINYQVSYAVYGGLGAIYTTTFVYNETTGAFSRAAGPVY